MFIAVPHIRFITDLPWQHLLPKANSIVLFEPGREMYTWATHLDCLSETTGLLSIEKNFVSTTKRQHLTCDGGNLKLRAAAQGSAATATSADDAISQELLLGERDLDLLVINGIDDNT